MKIKAEKTYYGCRMRFSDKENPSTVFQVSAKDLISLYLGLEKDAYVHDIIKGPVGHISMNADTDCYETNLNGNWISVLKEDVIKAIPGDQFNQLFYLGEFGNFTDNEAHLAVFGAQEIYKREIQANKENDQIDIFSKFEIRPFWHFCNIKNLRDILNYGLISKNGLEIQRINNTKIPYKDISNPEIQNRRDGKGLHDYVPIFFSNSAPMVSAIQSDSPIMGDIIALEIDRDILFLDNKIISDRNLGGKYECISTFEGYDDITVLKSIRRDLVYCDPPVPEEFWNETERHYRGAEILVKNTLPTQYIRGIHVFSIETEQKAQKIVRDSKKDIGVTRSLIYGGVDTKKLAELD